MKKTLKYLKPYTGTVVWGLVFKFVGSVAELFLPLVLDYIIDEVVPVKDTKMMIILGAAMLGLSFIALFGNIIANRFAAHSSGYMTRDLRYDLFRKTSYLKSSQVDSFTLPSLVSRLTSDTYYVNQAVARSLRLGVRAPILLIGGVILTFVLDWRLALVLLACVPLVTVAVVIITKKSVPMYTTVQRSGDAAVRSMQENISGVRVIKALSKTEYEVEKFGAVNDRLTADEFKTNKITSLTNPLATLVLSLGLVGVIAAGAYLSAEAGTVLAFLSFFTLILNAMLGISKIFVTLSRGVASAERIERVLEADERTEVVGGLPEGDPAYKIEFKDVSFSYNGVENNLENVSFKVGAGQTVGIIGGTGSGKSTIVALAEMFYTPDVGTVEFCGAPARDYDANAMRRLIGYVPQRAAVLDGTLDSNLRIADENLSTDREKRALELAQASELWDALGADGRILSGGKNLSGGQKQRVSIARALCRDNLLYLFDDATSALDYRTERDFINAMKSVPGAKIFVSQRISAVSGCDEILVIDGGRIVGSGTHEQLKKSCPLYAEFCASQSGE